MFFTFWEKLILLDKFFFLKIFKGKGLWVHLAQIAIKNIEKLKIQIFVNFLTVMKNTLALMGK